MDETRKGNAWFEGIKEFQEKDWVNYIENEESSLEKHFRNVVKEFENNLKRLILEKSFVRSEEAVLYLQEINEKICDVLNEGKKKAFENFDDRKEETENMKLHVKSDKQIMEEITDNSSDNIEESKSDIDSEDLQVVGNLFNRVLRIFYIDGRDLNELFEALDVSKDGRITFQELRLGLLKYDSTITHEETESVFNILDGNKDGHISLDEITKRIKLIHEKAEAENKDPLANIVFSKPLDPDLIHGNLSVILIKASHLKPGSHSVKISLKDSLEYLTADTQETNPSFNFRCEFLFENIEENALPGFLNVELFNRGKLEGSGSFLWTKAMESPNEFSYKVKCEVKTSTGQARGTLFFSVKWTPILVKNQEKEKVEKIKELVQKKKLEAESRKKEKGLDIQEEASEILEEIDCDFEAPSSPIEYFYMTQTTTKVLRTLRAPVRTKTVKSKETEIIDVRVNRQSTKRLTAVTKQETQNKTQNSWKYKITKAN